MSDRELLEMAAKAAGIEGEYKILRHSRRDHFKQIRHFSREAFVSKGLVWDPLDDDGDAFRLAIKLEMTLCAHGMGVYANSGDLMCSSPECTDNDRPALVRRTIVRLAAKIGSLKP